MFNTARGEGEPEWVIEIGRRILSAELDSIDVSEEMTLISFVRKLDFRCLPEEISCLARNDGVAEHILLPLSANDATSIPLEVRQLQNWWATAYY